MNRAVFDFAGSQVLVTGGSNGIGLAIATAFADAGATVTVTGTRADRSAYAHDLSRFTYRTLDVRDGAAISALGHSLDALDVLVNNAGANFARDPGEWDPAVFEDAIRLNLTGAFRLATAVRPLLARSRADGGASILNLASMSAFFAVTPVPGYGSAKAGIVQLTRTLAVAWASDGIRVNAVAPGLVRSNMTAGMQGVAAAERPFLDRTPMRRWGVPDDIPPACLFLASAGARFITGQTLCVDGGYSVA